MPTTSEDVLTRKQAAELLGLTKGGMRALEKTGLLNATPRREDDGRIVNTYAADKVMALVKEGHEWRKTTSNGTVTRSEAGDLLGLTKSGIASMERRGALAVQPGGVFDRNAVAQLVAERKAQEPGEGWITHRQAAELLGMPVKQLRNIARDGRLTTKTNASKRLFYDREEIEAYGREASYKPDLPEPAPLEEPAPDLLEMTALILHLMEPMLIKLTAIEERVNTLVKELTS